MAKLTRSQSFAIIQPILDAHIQQVAGWFYHQQIAPYLPELINFLLTELEKQNVTLEKSNGKSPKAKSA